MDLNGYVKSLGRPYFLSGPITMLHCVFIGRSHCLKLVENCLVRSETGRNEMWLMPSRSTKCELHCNNSSQNNSMVHFSINLCFKVALRED